MNQNRFARPFLIEGEIIKWRELAEKEKWTDKQNTLNPNS